MLYDRAAVLASVDLATLADQLLGPHAGNDQHPTWPCPNTEHAQTGRTPPVTVFTTTRGEERWHCHGCGDGGSAIDLVIACCRTDVRGALEYLAGRPPEPPPPHHRPLPPPTVTTKPDLVGLRRYVDDCATRLWQPAGAHVLAWLKDERRLDPDVLARNRIGADPGPASQPRPAGIARSPGAVLPVITGGQPIYAQLRVLTPRERQPRYLNPGSTLAPNPRIARIRPHEQVADAVIVTEGIIDALTAATAGYRAAAVLGAGYPNRDTADLLACLPGPLVLAFDPDDAGERGARRLGELLTERLRTPAVLPPGTGDLNERHLASSDWTTELHDLVAAASPSVGHPARELGRSVA